MGKKFKSNHIATCGHNVKEGISASVLEYKGAKEVTYGTYCHDCLEMYYRAGLLKNRELCLIFSKIKRLTRMLLDQKDE